MPGYICARRLAADQCVVARRPSSRLAAASTNAPVQTDAVRRALADVSLTHASSRSSVAAARVPCPPGTISVSTCAGRSTKLPSGTISRPLDVRSGAPSVLNVVIL